MRVAGIDCGTNSIRLLIADPDGDGGLADVVREMRIVRLGQDVDRTGRLAPAALERTRTALAGYAAMIREAGAQRVRLVATSATRDATNRDAFVAMVNSELGVDPEVVTGAEEAALTFAGAVASLPRLTGEVVVTDIGGGSTELVAARAGGLPEQVNAYSMDVGSVRMTERHLHDDPPTPPQVGAAVADIRAALDTATRTVALRPDTTLVGVAGTVTTIAAIALGLRRYDPDAVHGSRLSADGVYDVTRRLIAIGRDERAAIPVLHPGRVDVIGGGALVLRTIVERAGVAGLVVSEHDILDGIAASLLR